MVSKFYITTPIYYVNDNPHIGHAYTTILADVLARYHRISEDVFFLTGLDEHGQKVKQAASERGISPQDHCNELAPCFIELWKKLGIRFDDFIRTTEDRHKKIVQEKEKAARNLSGIASALSIELSRNFSLKGFLQFSFYRDLVSDWNSVQEWPLRLDTLITFLVSTVFLPLIVGVSAALLSAP